MKLKLIALLAVVALAAAACGDSSTSDTTASTEAPTTVAPATTDAMADLSDIVDTAVAAGDFTTLAAALEAADLVDTLKGEGPFTVFAPTDAAFGALPAGTLEGLLADIPTLTSILTYHVVPGLVKAEDVVGLTSATTVNGADVAVTVAGADVMINQANVTTTDILASNGVIHVIDAVILPPAAASDGEDAMADLSDIVDTAVAAGDFTTLAAALEAADLVDTLKGEGPFTVFAPTDAAFAALPAGTLEGLLEDIPTLSSILTYHVVPGLVKAEDVVGLTSATTVNGAEVSISVDGASVMIDGANVTVTDILASNGVIHVIDAVLLP